MLQLKTTSSLDSAAVAVMMRVAVIVVIVVAAMVSVTAALAATVSAVAVVCCHTPKAVASPSALLALFGAVFCASAAPTFGELPCIFFPLAALPECALSDTTS